MDLRATLISIFLILFLLPSITAAASGSPNKATEDSPVSLRFVTGDARAGCDIKWYIAPPGESYDFIEQDTLECCYAGGNYDTLSWTFFETGRYWIKVEYVPGGTCPSGDYEWYIDVEGCTVSNPDACDHYGPWCTNSRYWCSDAYWVNNYLYCVLDDIFDCGTDYCDDWEYYCSGTIRKKKQTCYDQGCESDACFSNPDTTRRTVEDCGSNYCDGFGSNFCENDDVFHTQTCYNRGCDNGDCYSNSYPNKVKVDECGTDSCDSFGSDYCKNGDVYHSQTCYNRGCRNDACFSDSYPNEVLVEECAYGCDAGACISCTAGWKCKNSTTRAYQNADCSWTNEESCDACTGDGVCNSFLKQPTAATQGQETTLRVAAINNFIQAGCPLQWFVTTPDGTEIPGETDTIECCFAGAYFDEATYDFPESGTYGIRVDFPAQGSCTAHTAEWDVVTTCSPSCQYDDVCDETAPDGCGGTCTRDTDGVSCGEYSVCNNGNCEIQPFCGDNICNGDETRISCPSDCADCTSGPCCDTGTYTFRPSSFLCDSTYGRWEYGCPWGSDLGNDAGMRIQQRFCSGNSESCEGDIIFSPWKTFEQCNTNEICSLGTCINNQLDNCNIPNGDFDKCTPDCQCSHGEGDCDTDSDCESGLKCIQDSGSDFGFNSEIDICQVVNDAPFDDPDYCSTTSRCKEGEGDCDSNDECENGLICQYDYGEFYGLASWVDVCEAEDYGCHSGAPGDSGFCSDTCKCLIGEGSCKSDSDCESGLVCDNISSIAYGYSTDTLICDIPGGSEPLPRDAYTSEFYSTNSNSLDSAILSLSDSSVSEQEIVRIPLGGSVWLIGLAHVGSQAHPNSQVGINHPCIRNGVLTVKELKEKIPHFNIEIQDISLPKGHKTLFNMHILFTKKYGKTCPVVYENVKYNYCEKVCKEPRDIIKNPPFPEGYPFDIPIGSLLELIKGLGLTDIKPWGPFDDFYYRDPWPYVFPAIEFAAVAATVMMIVKALLVIVVVA